MIIYTNIQAVFIYFYGGIYGIAAMFSFFWGLFSGDTGLIGLSILFVPLAYLLHLFAQAHFRMARRTQNYINFCKAVDIDDTKEHSEKFFKQFKFEVK